MLNFIIKRFRLRELRRPELICFDHLYSEYLSIRSLVKDEDEIQFIQDLRAKADRLSAEKSKKDRTETPDIWSDFYYFELIIAKYLPPEKLRTRVMMLRLNYRAVAGQREFDDYLAYWRRQSIA